MSLLTLTREVDDQRSGVRPRRLGSLVAITVAPLMALASLTWAAPTGASGLQPHAGQDVTGVVGQGVTLDGEQVHTVVQVQRWYGGGYWLPPAGKAVVTVLIKIDGLQKTSYNALYYSVTTPGGPSIGHSYLGSRDPSLGSSNDLMAGQSAQGWMSFVVPTTQINALTLVYTMHSGFGSTLRVPLGVVPDSPRTVIGRTAVLQSEQAVTATRVERPARNGMYVPKKGYKFITTYVKVRAIKTIKTGRFTAFAPGGKTFPGVLLGHRSPMFPELRGVAKGKTVQGWVTLMVPQNQTHGLTLVYHLSGYRDTLLIRIPG
jgi:hypothetical protein